MTARLIKQKAGFGTAPVFLTAISTILGAVMFLRFGYVVGNVGFAGAVAIVLIGHVVTISTAMSLAEIATNQKVEGGGEYFIISRSFGLEIGGAIGIALFLSQAISVAFYVIAFGEAFSPVFDFFTDQYGWAAIDKRLVTLPAMLLLALLIIRKGADVGMKVLYVVVGTLFLSLLMFFLGRPDSEIAGGFDALMNRIDNPDSFFLVFAICFPAFTGMTAGVGLSGDLKNPKNAPEALDADQLIMSRIALWGPIIPIGLAAATISSALGSALVAPRTLQALAQDRILPSTPMNGFLSQGKGETNEPVNASLLVFGIAIVFVAVGNVNFVAQIISMFFMVTYGSLCTISFLEHFAADPSYRPAFRSRWYISLLGALMCFWLMFQMSAPYAILSLVVMAALYLTIARFNPDRGGLARLFKGAIFQISRQMQVFLQKSSRQAAGDEDSWRPAVVCMSTSSFNRLDALELMRWVSHRFGFGTYIHFIKGYMSRSTLQESREVHSRLVRLADVSGSNIYMDTLINPSYTQAVSLVAQLPGISGKENNLILFDFDKDAPDQLDAIVANYQLVASADFDVCILGTSERGFGYCQEIHIWVTPTDFDNAGLMILLGYIILGHPSWKNGQMKLFAIFPEDEIKEQKEKMLSLIRSGRLPISAKNVELIIRKPGAKRRSIIHERSKDADLTIIGFVGQQIRHEKADFFKGYDSIHNVLFVNSTQEIELYDEQEDQEASLAEAAAEEKKKEKLRKKQGEQPEEPDESEDPEETIKVTEADNQEEPDDPGSSGGAA
jgi:amino acid transporter